MRKEDVKIGMRVVPFQKTTGQDFSKFMSDIEGDFLRKNGFVEVKRVWNTGAGLSVPTSSSFWEFNFEDFEPYVEPKQRTQTKQTKTQEEKKMTEKEKVAEAKRVRNKKMKELREKLGIERVIVNRNTLVCFFKDGTKQIEQAVGKDEFDIRVGIALAYAHKTAGSKMLFNEVVDKITSKVEVF